MLHFVDKIPILGPKPSILGLKSKTLRAQISIFCPKPPDFMLQTPIFHRQNPILGSKPQILCLKTLFLSIQTHLGSNFPSSRQKNPKFSFFNPILEPTLIVLPPVLAFRSPEFRFGAKNVFFSTQTPHFRFLAPHFGAIWVYLGSFGVLGGQFWGSLGPSQRWESETCA